MKLLNKKILLLISLMTALFIYGCSWEKEVQGPIPYKSDIATKINTKNMKSFNGNYIVDNFTMSYTNTEPNIPTLEGGFVVYFDDKNDDNESNDSLKFNYLVQYGGYPEIPTGNLIRMLNMDNLTNYTVEDNYTIRFNTPVTLSDGDKTYTIETIRKNDDSVIIIDDATVVDDFQYRTVCDPTLPIDNNNSKTCGLNGALKYIGSYRIESLKCGGTEYVGGVDFAGEMVASPKLINGANVNLPITFKIQVKTEALKNCMLTSDEIANNSMIYKTSTYEIQAADAANLSAVFEKVGLIGLKTGSEVERTTQIDYLPKDSSYKDLTFNNNSVEMRLRIMRTGELGGAPAKVLDENKTYFTIQ